MVRIEAFLTTDFPDFRCLTAFTTSSTHTHNVQNANCPINMLLTLLNLQLKLNYIVTAPFPLTVTCSDSHMILSP